MKPRIILTAPVSKHTRRIHVTVQLRELDNAGHGDSTIYSQNSSAYIEFPAERRSLYVKLERLK